MKNLGEYISKIIPRLVRMEGWVRIRMRICVNNGNVFIGEFLRNREEGEKLSPAEIWLFKERGLLPEC